MNIYVTLHLSLGLVVASGLAHGQTLSDIQNLYESRQYTAAEDALTTLSQQLAAGKFRLDSSAQAEIAYFSALTAFGRNDFNEYCKRVVGNREVFKNLNSDKQEEISFMYGRALSELRDHQAAEKVFADFALDHPDSEFAGKAKCYELLSQFSQGEDEFLNTWSRQHRRFPRPDEAPTVKVQADLRRFVENASAALAESAFVADPDSKAALEEKVWQSRIALGEEAQLLADRNGWPEEKREQFDFSRAKAYYQLLPSERRPTRKLFKDFIAAYPASGQVGLAQFHAATCLYDLAKSNFNTARAVLIDYPNDSYAYGLCAEGRAMFEQFGREYSQTVRSASYESIPETNRTKFKTQNIEAGWMTGNAPAAGDEENDETEYGRVAAKIISTVDDSQWPELRDVLSEFIVRHPDSPRAATVRYSLIHGLYQHGMYQYKDSWRWQREGNPAKSRACAEEALAAIGEFCRQYELHRDRLVLNKRNQDRLQLRYWEGLIIAQQASPLLNDAAAGSPDENRMVTYAQTQALYHTFQLEEFRRMARPLLADAALAPEVKDDLMRDYFRSYVLEAKFEDLEREAETAMLREQAGSMGWAVCKFYIGTAASSKKEPDLNKAAEAFDAILASGLQDASVTNHLPSNAAFWRAEVASQQRDAAKVAEMTRLLDEQMPEGPIRAFALNRFGPAGASQQ